MVTTTSARTRKGKNFSQDEERQLCRSFLHVSQDPINGNGQRATAFWERIWTHYKANRPIGGEERRARSLETKWGAMKHDCAKFAGVYKAVSDCQESGTSLGDVMQRALDLYKVKHPKQSPFVFLHCWTLLREVPRWWDLLVDVRQRAQPVRTPVAMPKRKAAAAVVDVPDDDAGDNELEILSDPMTWKRPTRPGGNKAAKEAQKLQKQRDMSARAQAKATANMAAANLRRAQSAQDQAALVLFTMPNEESLSSLARKFLNLRRKEEMTKLRKRIAEKKLQAEKDAAEAKRQATEHASEVVQATQGQALPTAPPT
jgi:hypothetical protein